MQLALTGTQVVDMLITDLGVYELTESRSATLIELATDVTLDEVREKTEASFNVTPGLA